MVPAEAEIVIEGYVNTEYLEPEAPFGESHGHVNLQEYNGFMDVTCITRKRDAIFMIYISQLAPSESSVRSRVTVRGDVPARICATHRHAAASARSCCTSR